MTNFYKKISNNCLFQEKHRKFFLNNIQIMVKNNIQTYITEKRYKYLYIFNNFV
jgi:hypothetical protein